MAAPTKDPQLTHSSCSELNYTTDLSCAVYTAHGDDHWW